MSTSRPCEASVWSVREWGRANGDERVCSTSKYTMTSGEGEADGGPPVDARCVALAQYLRRSAASFSMSADSTDGARTAEAGMALLDAAVIAESLPSDDAGIRVLSEAGLFESMPGGRALFVEAAAIRAAVLRALVSEAQDGRAIIAKLVATAARLGDDGDPHPRGQEP